MKWEVRSEKTKKNEKIIYIRKESEICGIFLNCNYRRDGIIIKEPLTRLDQVPCQRRQISQADNLRRRS